MNGEQPDGEPKWATISRWPAGTDVEQAERNWRNLKDALAEIAPEASNNDLCGARFDIVLAESRVPKIDSESKIKAKLSRLRGAMAELKAALDGMTTDELKFIRLQDEESFNLLGKELFRQFRRSREGYTKDIPDDEWLARITERKPTATAVAKAAFDAFQSLTGRRPTIITPVAGGRAHGPFIDLLDAAFKMTGVTASPESQGRKVLRIWS